MGLRVLKKTVSILLLCALFLGSLLAGFFLADRMAVSAASKEKYPLIYGEIPESDLPTVVLIADEQDYTVLPGDSLWKIAEKFLGDGNAYVDIAKVNKELILDPNLIFPGTDLSIEKTGRIVREEAGFGGLQMGDYSMDIPRGFTAGIRQSGDAYANFSLSGDKGAIACLIRDKKEETAQSVKDWKKCSDLIAEYARENYGKQVLDLQFEHYRMVDQEGASGNLYLYSFIWQVSPDHPNLKQSVCVGLKLTDHVQAEFVGFGADHDIYGCVRYVTATFAEHYDPDSAETFTVNDSNMQMAPLEEWEPGGIINSFAWVDEYFTSALERAMGIEEDKGVKEKLMDKMGRS